VLGVNVVDTDAYGSRAVPVRVVDGLVKDSYINDAGNFVEAVYEDEFAFTVTARRNRKPDLGDDRDLGTVVVGTQKAKNTAKVSITSAKPDNRDIASANFIDDDTLTYNSDSSPSKASFDNGTVTGKGSTWESGKHVPLVMGISAEDTGMLSTATIPLKIVVDGAPSPSATDIPVTVIEDTGTEQVASFNWWQFFEDKEGGLSPTEGWDDLTIAANTLYAAAADANTQGVVVAEGSLIPADTAATARSVRYSLRAWSSDPSIAVVVGNSDNSVSEALEVDNLSDDTTDGIDVTGRLQLVGNAVGEAMITVVLTEPTAEVYTVQAFANQDDSVNLVHAGNGQYAVKRFMVKVVEEDTTDR
jgi:hypothetical protein